ncbi:hypothetical protein [Pseudomonas phage vB_Pa-PAC2]
MFISFILNIQRYTSIIEIVSYSNIKFCSFRQYPFYNVIYEIIPPCSKCLYDYNQIYILSILILLMIV